jgi:glycosyltransferase involved in cell wall biosynthesis
MRILVVSTALPYPLYDGGRKGVFFPIKSLAERGHSLHLICLTRKVDAEAVRVLSQYCTVDTVFCASKPSIRGALQSLCSTVPYDSLRYRSQELMAKIREILKNSRFDIVQAEGIHVAWCGTRARQEFGVPAVLRVHSLQHMNMLRLVGSFKNPLLNLFIKYDGLKMRRHEAQEGRRCDVNMVVSDVDGAVLRSLDSGITTMTVPAGVDLAEFTPSTVQPERNSVLWMGSLGWPPNQDSFWWFYRKIVPHLVQLVPDVHIRVAGSNPPDDILAVRHPNVSVLGFVPDIREVMQQAQVCVVPLQAGSGIRIKLLEMFAMQKAVVSTSIGCEGLNVEHGNHLLVADQPEDFAASVARLLADPNLCTALGASGFRHAREKYGWDAIAAKYEEAYRMAIDRSGTR